MSDVSHDREDDDIRHHFGDTRFAYCPYYLISILGVHDCSKSTGMAHLDSSYESWT